MMSGAYNAGESLALVEEKRIKNIQGGSKRLSTGK